MSDLLRMSALQQAALLRSGHVSSRELTNLYLERIDRFRHLGAFTTIHEKEALALADKADRELKDKRNDAPFLGVPSAIKDLHPTKEAWTHFGSQAIFYPPIKDCITAASLRRAGFVFVGKTNASEFGAIPITEPDNYLPARTPWNLQHTAGGSSGGAATAVSAGLLPIAHGSDGGGSVRIPAALCHLYGFKPSRWLLPNAYGKRHANIIYTCGPISRTVEDAAAMMDAMIASKEQHDLRIFVPSLQASIKRPLEKGLRVRLIVDNPLFPSHEEAKTAARKTAKLLEAAGAIIEEYTYPEVTLNQFIPIWGRVLSEMPTIFPWKLQPATKWLLDEAKKLTNAQIDELEQRMVTLVKESLVGYDLVVSPTVPIRPPAIGSSRRCSGEVAFQRAAPLGVFTAPHNLAGQPAAAIPAGIDSEGFPLSVQVASTRGRDGLVMQVSRYLEETMPWSKLWAPNLWNN
jgi:amidase